ncbi:MAG: prepilin-type N-terminal cleavage/methylation domain-containing protein [Aquificaceae bacterium]
MRKLKGFTLVELLVVMVLSLIIGAGLVALYRNLVGNVAERSTVVKNQAQLNFVMDNLAKLLSTAGFGIDKDNINQAINIINNNRLEILTRVASQETNAGCWGIIDQSGNFKLQVSNNDTKLVSFNTYRECPNDKDQYPVKINILTKSSNCTTSCLAFRNDPTSLRLYLNSQNLHPSCLQGTQRLMLDMNGTPQEILQCVAHLRFRYLTYDGNELVPKDERPSDVRNIAGVRICMMVQLSEFGSKTQESQKIAATGAYEEIEYTPQCGGENLTQLNPALQNTWRNKKWERVELDVFMPNLQY